MNEKSQRRQHFRSAVCASGAGRGKGLKTTAEQNARANLDRRNDTVAEPFRPYERLVEIKILGKSFHVPEKNSVLRCFQFLSPETIPYGRFCWNQECQYCRIEARLPDDDQSREMLSCKFLVMPGMTITDVSQELKWCLRAKLRR